MWKFDAAFLLVVLLGTIRSSIGMSMRPALPLKRVMSLLLALRSTRAFQSKSSKFFFELPEVKA